MLDALLLVRAGRRLLAFECVEITENRVGLGSDIGDVSVVSCSSRLLVTEVEGRTSFGKSNSSKRSGDAMDQSSTGVVAVTFCAIFVYMVGNAQAHPNRTMKMTA